MNTYRLDELPALLEKPLGTSDWVLVDQARIDLFAQATGDHQWIHTDPTQAANGPFGTTIAHGFLTLSLIPLLSKTAFDISGSGMAVNYGVNRVRFTSPVPVDSQLRGHFKLLGFEPRGKGHQLTIEVTVERQGHEQPACLAQMVSLRY